MILVDTSVLIDFLRGIDNKSTGKFKKVLTQKIPFGITSVIFQEILQGAKSEQEYSTLKTYLETQHFFILCMLSILLRRQQNYTLPVERKA